MWGKEGEAATFPLQAKFFKAAAPAAEMPATEAAKYRALHGGGPASRSAEHPSLEGGECFASENLAGTIYQIRRTNSIFMAKHSLYVI